MCKYQHVCLRQERFVTLDELCNTGGFLLNNIKTNEVREMGFLQERARESMQIELQPKFWVHLMVLSNDLSVFLLLVCRDTERTMLFSLNYERGWYFFPLRRKQKICYMIRSGSSYVCSCFLFCYFPMTEEASAPTRSVVLSLFLHLLSNYCKQSATVTISPPLSLSWLLIQVPDARISSASPSCARVCVCTCMLFWNSVVSSPRICQFKMLWRRDTNSRGWRLRPVSC